MMNKLVICKENTHVIMYNAERKQTSAIMVILIYTYIIYNKSHFENML